MDRVHFYFSLSHSFWIISVTISLTSLTPLLPLDSHPRTVAFLAGGAWREGEGGRCPFLLEVPVLSFSSPLADSMPYCHSHMPADTLHVVGMKIRVGQGQSYLPADVPGITATSGRGSRLQPKGRLRQQLAGDFIIEGPSRRR
jgi:hypothetical protein